MLSRIAETSVDERSIFTLNALLQLGVPSPSLQLVHLNLRFHAISIGYMASLSHMSGYTIARGRDQLILINIDHPWNKLFRVCRANQSSKPSCTYKSISHSCRITMITKLQVIYCFYLFQPHPLLLGLGNMRRVPAGPAGWMKACITKICNSWSVNINSYTFEPPYLLIQQRNIDIDRFVLIPLHIWTQMKPASFRLPGPGVPWGLPHFVTTPHDSHVAIYAISIRHGCHMRAPVQSMERWLRYDTDPSRLA